MRRLRILRTVVFLLCLQAAFFLTLNDVLASELSAFAQELLQLNPATEQVLQKYGNLLEIKPVALPEGDLLLGVNDHFGWPVAVKSGNAINVIYYRTPYHWGESVANDSYTSPAVMTRSTDGGDTWSTPYSLKVRVATPTVEVRSGFGNAMGVDDNGDMIAVTRFGVFRSENQGALWNHVPGAFGSSQLGPMLSNGPRIIKHPDYGWLLACQRVPGDDEGPVPELWFRASQDGGDTWTETMREVPDGFANGEPSLMMHNGAMLVVARSQDDEVYDPVTLTRPYPQFYSATGSLSLDPAMSTIVNSITPWSHSRGSSDTVDVSYNPVSGRIEVVATDRWGNAGSSEPRSIECQTLNLWSIDPDDLANGSSDWRFEVTLLKRDGMMYYPESEIDGMHPGGAVMDLDAGVQHIFFYAGEPTGPTGIFDLVRSLDTPRLRDAILYDVPEPSPLSMLISGGLFLLIGIGWLRIRHNTASSKKATVF